MGIKKKMLLSLAGVVLFALISFALDRLGVGFPVRPLVAGVIGIALIFAVAGVQGMVAKRRRPER